MSTLYWLKVTYAVCMYFRIPSLCDQFQVLCCNNVPAYFQVCLGFSSTKCLSNCFT